MKVILFMAMSVNGIIARENGDEDFLSHENWTEFAKVCNEIGCLIWGRKTYEKVITWDKEYLAVMANVRKIIISRDATIKLDPRFSLAPSPKEAINLLSIEGFQKVILTGGSTNNSSFAKEGLIGEVILNVESTIIGKGVPLFNPVTFQLNLELIDSKPINNKIIQLRYKVI